MDTPSIDFTYTSDETITGFAQENALAERFDLPTTQTNGNGMNKAVRGGVREPRRDKKETWRTHVMLTVFRLARPTLFWLLRPLGAIG